MYFIIFIIIVIIDQITKLLLINSDITIIPNILNFSYIENTGAAFGMFDKQIVLVANIIIITAICIYWIKSKKNNIKNIAFVLIISGSIGNLADRLFRGYVIDFIKITIFDNLPIFNIADISIVVGIFILMFYITCERKGK